MAPEPSRRTTLAPKEFLREFAGRNRPVVLTGERSWRDTEPFTLGRLRGLVGARRLDELRDGGGGTTNIHERHVRAFPTLGDYLDALAASETRAAAAEPEGARAAAGAELPNEFALFSGLRRKEDASGLPYITNVSLACVPELDERFTTAASFGKNLLLSWKASREIATGELFIGPASSGYGELHFDQNCLYVATYQLYGTKRWWLYPPDQSRFLYPIPYPTAWYPNYSPIDPEQPDLRRYPDFANARGFVTDLRAGEVLFCPASWWHNTKNLTASVSIAVRMVLRTNAKDVVMDWMKSRLIDAQVRRFHHRVREQ
jgi:hypothetical protein